MTGFLKGSEPESAKSLKKNVLAWVTKGRHTSGWEIVEITNGNITKHDNNTVRVWKCSQKLSMNSVDDLLKYVFEGGNLVLGVTPWGYLQIHGGSLETIPPYVFLKKVGIYLTEGYIDMNNPARVEENIAPEAHTGRSLKDLADGALEPSSDITRAIASIPEKDCAEVLMELGLCNIHCKPPTDQRPLDGKEMSRALLANVSLKRTCKVAPGVDHFPGNFSSPPPISCLELSIDSIFSEAHPVGAYLPAGGTLSIQALRGNLNGWRIQVGCHTDNLSHGNHKALKRWPDITVSCTLNDGTTEVSSSFGGSIYMWSPEGKRSVTIFLRNVVLSPIYRHSEDIAEWPKSRQNPGLWADFIGQHIMISVPSREIRDLEDPGKVMEFWDSVVAIHNDLKGDDISMKKKEWIVPDVQPSCGYMHSGYPIITHMDVASKSAKNFLMRAPANAMEQDHWGFFHELGHNMQESAWTFQGTGEVTCNIFTLNAMHHLFGIAPWDHPWLQNQKNKMKSYLAKGAAFQDWQRDPGVGLGIYAQLARDFGFKAYKTVFRQYKEEKPVLSTEQEKIDHWVMTFSQVVKQNLEIGRAHV